MSLKKQTETIPNREDLLNLSPEQLLELARTLRRVISETVSETGGHLASNLGIVELTLALHRVFDFQKDRLVWDVGHQCYVHKLLTGRANRFATLRQTDGLSGFPDPEESPSDSFRVGHAGTAISTAIGLAMGDRETHRRVVAVVGDASIVNGLSFEALNHAHVLKRQLLIILNDNSMAISETQGALARYFNMFRTGSTYEELRRATLKVLNHIPVIGQPMHELADHVRKGLKTTLWPGEIFDQLGLRYFGPVDGHDTQTLIELFQRLREVPEPVVLHVLTQKGRGFAPATRDPTRCHSPGPFKVSGEVIVTEKSERKSFTAAFTDSLLDLAETDERIVALTAAMPDGTGLTRFRERFGDRTIDVGICESHAMALAAGLARAGKRPMVVLYSTFLQRTFDQLWQEVALNRLPVVICIDRAGVVGSDGPTHHGLMDLALTRILPGMTCLSPADEPEMHEALRFAFADKGPVAIRYPRAEVPESFGQAPAFVPGRARVLRNGKDATIFAYGLCSSAAMAAADMLEKEDKQIEVVNARFARPLDEKLIEDRLKTGAPFLIAEEHLQDSGLGAAVITRARARRLDTRPIALAGFTTPLIPHAPRAAQLHQARLDAAGLADRIRDLLP